MQYVLSESVQECVRSDVSLTEGEQSYPHFDLAKIDHYVDGLLPQVVVYRGNHDNGDSKHAEDGKSCHGVVDEQADETARNHAEGSRSQHRRLLPSSCGV